MKKIKDWKDTDRNLIASKLRLIAHETVGPIIRAWLHDLALAIDNY